MSKPIIDEGLANRLIKEIAQLKKILSEIRTKPKRGLELTDGITAPSAVTGRAIIYVDTADGDLKVKFGDGTTKTISTDT